MKNYPKKSFILSLLALIFCTISIYSLNYKKEKERELTAEEQIILLETTSRLTRSISISYTSYIKLYKGDDYLRIGIDDMVVNTPLEIEIYDSNNNIVYKQTIQNLSQWIINTNGTLLSGSYLIDIRIAENRYLRGNFNLD